MLLVVVCFLCCNIRENDNLKEQGKIIKIVQDNQIQSNLKLSEFFSCINIVPLENSKIAMIGNPQKLKIWNNKFYIQDKKRNCTSVFSANGELIYSTQKQIGKGPDEYVSCGNYAINSQNGNILIVDHFKSSINEYDLTGKLIKKIKYPKNLIRINDFEMLNENIFAFYSNHGFNNKKSSLVLFKPSNNEIFRELAPIPESRLHVSTNSNILYKLNKSLHLNHSFPSPSTYFVDNNGFRLHEKYHYDFGSIDFDPTVLPTNSNPKLHGALLQDYYAKYAIIFDKLENNNYAFISFFHKKSSGIAIYNKNTKKLFTKLNTPKSKGMLLSPQFVDDQYLYYLTSPDNIKYIIEPKLLPDLEKKHIGKISNDNNLVIIKYKFKN
jgi:hypothetical protein